MKRASGLLDKIVAPYTYNDSLNYKYIAISSEIEKTFWVKMQTFHFLYKSLNAEDRRMCECFQSSKTSLANNNNNF